MSTVRVERSFPLPPGSDADVVAETVRAIIATSTSTEHLVIETSPALLIRAVIHVPAAPEDQPQVESLWDVLMKRTEIHAIEDKSGLHGVADALQHACVYGAPVAVLVKSKTQLLETLDIPKATRLLGVPVLEAQTMDEEDTVVILTAPSGVVGPLRADHAVLFHLGGEHGSGKEQP